MNFNGKPAEQWIYMNIDYTIARQALHLPWIDVVPFYYVISTISSVQGNRFTIKCHIVNEGVGLVV